MKRWLVFSCIVLGCGILWADEPATSEDTHKKSESWTKMIDFSGLFYLTYENGTLEGEDYNRFFVTRAYFTAEMDILPFLSGRVTFDTAQDLEGQGRGDMEVRLKYAFAKFHFPNRGILNHPNLEAGIVHMVWLDFEEHINLYRMRGPMFMERSGIFNSADFGLTFASGLGEDLDEAFRSYAGNKYGTRNGSLAVGIYNGSGYHGDERNVNKTVEARLTWRPLPDSFKGLQLAGMVIHGEGNVEEEVESSPLWKTYNAFLAYQFLHGTVTAQYVWGQGNQRGTWIEPDNPSQAMSYSGYSGFLEWKFGDRHQWRVIGGYDDFERVADNGENFSFTYVYGSFGYDFGRENILMLDFDRRDWTDPLRETDDRVQVVMQLKF
jgi:hypothetical protein